MQVGFKALESRFGIALVQPLRVESTIATARAARDVGGGVDPPLFGGEDAGLMAAARTPGDEGPAGGPHALERGSFRRGRSDRTRATATAA